MKRLTNLLEQVGFVFLTVVMVVFTLAAGLLATASVFAVMALPVASLGWLVMQVMQ